MWPYKHLAPQFSCVLFDFKRHKEMEDVLDFIELQFYPFP